jgi:hypothetical protein
VQRAYDGHVVQGRFIMPEAYAAFLRGAAAEASGDLRGALEAYEEASKLDSTGAEIWTRIGEVRCRANPRDALADESFARALGRERTYARAWAARAKCALARGDVAGARAAAAQAAELDPSADGANVLLASTAPPAQSDTTRAALLALTVTARDPVLAWGALAAWAEEHGDVPSWSRALKEIARISSDRRDEVARGAEELAGLGQVWEAREVAAAAADAEARPLAPRHALAARLAVDEAITHKDAGAVSRRATRVRVPLDEAAGRALLMGNRLLARELALAVEGADPTAVGARLVLVASDETDLVGAAQDARSQAGLIPAAAFVAFAAALAHGSPPQFARAALDGMPHEAITAGDDVVVRAAVELAARGALAAEALPPDGQVELAALGGAARAGETQAAGGGPLDARHEYLALAVRHPGFGGSPDGIVRDAKGIDGKGHDELVERVRLLRSRFTTIGGSDPIVAAASALMDLAAGTATTATARGLLARDAGDPLLVAAALRIAEKVGDHDVARRAREVLTALGTRSRGVSVE